MINKNKKAIILPETLKLVIAVICLVLLMYLAWSLYSLFVVKSKLAQAQGTLDGIAAKFQGLQEGETRDYLIVAPKDWRIISYGAKICICPPEIPEKQEATCNRLGYCLTSDSQLRISSFCFYSMGNCISLQNLPKTVLISKGGNTIELRGEGQGITYGIVSKMLEFKSGEKDIKSLIDGYLTNPNSENKDLLIKAVKEFLISEKLLTEEDFARHDKGFELVLTDKLGTERNIKHPLHIGSWTWTREQNLGEFSGESYTLSLNIGSWSYTEVVSPN